MPRLLKLARDVQRGLPVGQCPLGEGKLLLGQALGQIGIDNGPDERDPRRATALIGGKIAFERGFALRAQATEKIDLEAGQRGVGGELAELVASGLRRTRLGRRGGDALAREAGAGIDRGQLRATGNAELRAGSFHVERGDTQIAIVLQRQIDEPLQPRIAEHLPPVERCGSGSFVRGRKWIGRRYGGGRRFQPWIHRASAGQQQRGEGKFTHLSSPARGAGQEWRRSPGRRVAGCCPGDHGPARRATSPPRRTPAQRRWRAQWR